MALVNAIGLSSGILTIVGFFQSNLPAKPAEGTTVSVKVGLGDDDSDNLSGGIGAIYGFDTNNNYIGKAAGAKVGTGGFREFTIDQSVPGMQGDFISVESTNDAICIAWVSVGMFDDSPGGAWTGDIGFNCGQRWYEGNQVAGKDNDTGELYKPRCTWIDGDDTGDFETSALKFRTRAYGEKSEDTLDNNKECSETAFGKDPGPINGIPGAKRAVPTRRPWMEQRLIMSNGTSHSAANLCRSETSYGPDFLSADGQFCDMVSKTLSPLCSVKEVDGCVDVDASAMTVHKRSSVAKRTSSLLHKSYSKVSQWS
ncbi:unnamed protein product [Zymoseptoria tritici ST99CH_1E4]|uniref:Uncharacterized protein n=1 Tax=Zymoseptoria tritici ST99CH_1E4 TaxID=1276532 RepID=A0A2H1GCG2_ZYMTR|nr:unnamed protein product [Zymoseptoria tritici ST99CH_1E4]